MIKVDLSKPFHASWNANNSQLNSDQGLLWNLIGKVKNIVFYIPNTFIAACINPRSAPEIYTTNKKIFTPDNVQISAEICLIKDATSQTPTAILFNPLGANSEIQDDLQYTLLQKKCNVVKFDYRGLGSTWRPEDLVLDGDSVYQYVVKELGIQSSKVHFYGFSLGGAIAAQVKALHPESAGKYVGDRPFASIFTLITEICCLSKLGCVIKKITSFAAAIFIAYPVYLLDWELNGKQALEKASGDKLIIYHPNDYLVPWEAALASKLPEAKRLSLDPQETGPSTHFAPINRHSTSYGKKADLAIADFLMS